MTDHTQSGEAGATRRARPCFLYRLYGEDDELLYIGISLSALGRLSEHLAEKSWAAQVRRTTIETYPTRAAAAAAEVAAIKSEWPTYNVQHNGRRTPEKPVWVFDEAPDDDNHWPFPFGLGDCVALGLRNGRCVYGVIERGDLDTVTLALEDGWGTFGHQFRRIEWSEVEAAKPATSYTLDEVKVRKARGIFDCVLTGDEDPQRFRYYDTQELREWKACWEYARLPYEAKACRCGSRDVWWSRKAIGDMGGLMCHACGELFWMTEAHQKVEQR